MRIVRWAVLVLAMAGLLASNTSAAEATAEAGVFSKYVWRGQILNEDPMVQLVLDVNAGHGLTFATWAYYDLTDANSTEVRDTKNEFTEVDFYLEYALPLEGAFGASAGFAEYLYPNGEKSTREVYTTLSYEAWLSPSLSLFYDFGTVDGLYAVLEVSHEFEVSEQVVLTPGLSVGGASNDYNASVYGVDSTVFNDGNAFVTADWSLTETVTLSGLVQYTTQLDSEIRDALEAEDGETDAFFGGVKVSVTF